MDACHILLSQPYKLDHHTIHDGYKNTYIVDYEGKKVILMIKKEPSGSNSLVTKPIFLKTIREVFIVYDLLIVEENHKDIDYHKEVKLLLEQF